MKQRVLCFCLVFILATCVFHSAAKAQDNASADADETTTADGVAFFENRIRPVLVEHCYKCHSAQAKSPKGDLLLDTREATRAGGESGHAVVPGDLESSLILSALRYDSFEMPPSGQLPESVITDFEAWIQMGAPDPRDGESVAVAATTIDVERGREFWAFQSPRLTSPPEDPQGWSFNAIDQFLRAEQRQAGLTPVQDADRATLIRRVYLDLIGLPPTPDQIRAFQQDRSDTAWESVVNQLLESPHFGERWGRHWLDVVRYAESTGRTRNFPYPFAWRYRDYVIASLNDDKPYDQFIVEQLAGDLLPSETPEQADERRIATGFLALGAHDLNERNNAIYLMEVVGDQLDVLGRSVMGLTLGCARCHDHKFDPIPTADYYAMAGIFRSTQMLNGYTNRRQNNQYANDSLFVKLDATSTEETLPTADETPRGRRPQEVTDEMVRTAREQLSDARQARKKLDQRKKQGEEIPPAELDAADESITRLQQRFQRLRQRKNLQQQRRNEATVMTGPYAMGVREANRINDCPIHVGGEVDSLSDVVPRGFLQVVQVADTPTITDDQSGRIELAHWLTREDHPLTARVIVNRVWHHLFGQGIVTTVDNFGAMGSRPSHPELLDYLALQFVREGWSVKQLIRTLVSSRTYQLSTQYDEKSFEVDPDNVLLWRMAPRRLEAEIIRDALLAISGQLDVNPPHGSPIQKLPAGQLRRRDDLLGQLSSFPYRSIYLPIVRSRVPEYLTTFDFPEPSDVQGNREVTTVATQALFMMNSPMVQAQSRLAAERLLQHGFTGPRDLVEQAYLMALGRPPTDEQLLRAMKYVRETRLAMDEEVPRRVLAMSALTDLFHALFASAEFRYR